ncbi:MAG: zinc ribbon domain-containing protein [Nitrospirota bacterium]
MPIYEYLAERCDRQSTCSLKKEYLQRVSDAPLTACRECGAPIRRVFSSFAARSGSVGVSRPDPTPLNVTGIPAPTQMPGGGAEGPCGGGHGHEH